MGHSPGHDRDPLAVRAPAFSSYSLWWRQGPNVVPFLPVSIFVHQKKGEHMSKSCGPGYSPARHYSWNGTVCLNNNNTRAHTHTHRVIGVILVWSQIIASSVPCSISKDFEGTPGLLGANRPRTNDTLTDGPLPYINTCPHVGGSPCTLR